ncbi:TolC family outer membrane protein [Chitinimonas sp. BJB300]|uniref:TolC family outer membrane protein n=1 Tax=Chitinimonas sp. BJB300 TaxID=1559339 RepID=UPI000C0EB0B5|nr:TolC family outer membrane protein [Chitinimonas sp. BJB300]PHV09946.1 channel protein TolC [Chitinimonas sp. BJB300]TSJ90887.1 TolC family outer membrane protein [Chitinimonas sp. BJB300]
MQRFALRTLTCVLALATGSFASAADLLQVYQEAKKYDATYAAAEAAFRAGQEKTNQARALWLPKVALSGDAKRLKVDKDSSGLPSQNSNGSGNQFGYKLEATQPLYNAEVSVGASQLNEQARLAEVSFAVAKQDLILRVAQSYFDVLYAQDSLEFVRAQKDAVSQQLAQAKKSFEVGVATITDTHEAQAKYDGIIASEIAAQNDLVVKQNAFLQLTGVPAEGLAALPPKMEATPPNPPDMNEWVKLAEQKSLSIDAQRGKLAIAEAEIDKYRLSRQPTVGLFAQYGQDTSKGGVAALGGTDKTKTTAIGVQLNIPIFTGGNTSSKLRESIALRNQAQFNLEVARREAAQTTKQAFLGVQAGASQIRALDQAQISAQSSLDSTKLGREVGVRTTLDLLNAQQQLYSTKKDLAQARYSYLLNQLKLAVAVGDLAEKDLESVNSHLAP